jgi:hypothetical protein
LELGKKAGAVVCGTPAILANAFVNHFAGDLACDRNITSSQAMAIVTIGAEYSTGPAGRRNPLL